MTLTDLARPVQAASVALTAAVAVALVAPSAATGRTPVSDAHVDALGFLNPGSSGSWAARRSSTGGRASRR